MDFLGIDSTELVGYLASAAVLVSFVMRKVRTLRMVNIIGCAFFVAYGFLLAISWPIIITNLAIVIINCYYLFFAKSKEETV